MTAIEAVCEIIQHELELPEGRVFLWNEKFMQPSDHAMWVVVQILSQKAFGKTRRYVSTPTGLNEELSVNMMATLSIDILSRGHEARDRKEEVLLALGSTYAELKQTELGFHIAGLPSGFTPINQEDGAAVPFRFNISVNVQYSVGKQKSVAYYDNFEEVSIKTDP